MKVLRGEEFAVVESTTHLLKSMSLSLTRGVASGDCDGGVVTTGEGDGVGTGDTEFM